VVNTPLRYVSGRRDCGDGRAEIQAAQQQRNGPGGRPDSGEKAARCDAERVVAEVEQLGAEEIAVRAARADQDRDGTGILPQVAQIPNRHGVSDQSGVSVRDRSQRQQGQYGSQFALH
jgi:hypothetical protein